MFNTKTAVRKIIGSTKRGSKNDWDGDGVVNKKDCQPRNTMRQDKFQKPSKQLGPPKYKKDNKVFVYDGTAWLPGVITKVRFTSSRWYYDVDTKSVYGEFTVPASKLKLA